MRKSANDGLNEWLKVYLIFGAASFLLGFAGYLVARPQGIAARFTERWSDLTGRLPIARDLTWLESPAVPTFNSRKLPIILLVVPVKAEWNAVDLYPFLETGLRNLKYDTVTTQLTLTDDWDDSIRNNAAMYRKYIVIGIRDRPDNPSSKAGYSSEMVIGTNPYLSPDIFPALADELPKQLDSYKWEQASYSGGQLVSIQWNDGPAKNFSRHMAELCLKVLEKARSGLSKDYEI